MKINETKPTPNQSLEPIPHREFLGAGKEKVVYEGDDPHWVSIEPQPGKASSLRQECNKVKDIFAEASSATRLALDFTEDRIQADRYTALRGTGDACKLFTTISPGQAYQVGLDVLTGMKELHAAGYVHGDFKPDNVFTYEIDKTLVAKIADFGKTQKLAAEETDLLYGNRQYAPPENILSQKGEVYSTGLFLIRLLEAEQNIPAEKSIEEILIEQVSNKIISCVTRISAYIFGSNPFISSQDPVQLHIDNLTASNAMKQLLRDMTHIDPAQRPTMEQALTRYSEMLPLENLNSNI